LLQEVLE